MAGDGAPHGGCDVGLIGVGMLGALIAESLVGAGHRVQAFDHDCARVDAIAGVRAGRTACEVVSTSDLVLCCLDGPASAASVLACVDDREPGAERTGCVWVEVTTMSPAAAIAEADVCARHGIAFVECPVSGTPPHLTALVGGTADAVERAEPVLATFAARIVHVGPVGTASVVKLVNQYLTYGNLMLASHGAAVAARFGIDAHALADALATCAGSSRSLELFGDIVRDGGARRSSAAAILDDLRMFAGLLDGESAPALSDLLGLFADFDGTEPYPAVFVGDLYGSADHV